MRFPALVFGCLLALAVPPAASAAPAAPLTPLGIEVPSTSNLQFLTLWVAIGGGFFEKQGLKPELQTAPSPRETGQLLLQGKADIALLPPPMYLGYIEEHQPIVLFANLLANEPINIVVAGKIAATRNLAGKSLSQRLRALRGLKIGLAPEVGPRLALIYKAAGLNVEKDIQRVTVAGPDQVEAFKTGQVDALFAHTPYLETALTAQNGFLVVEASHGEIPALAGGEIHSLATTRAIAARKPELIARVRRAIGGAERLIHSDPDATLRALTAYGASPESGQALATIAAIYGPAVPLKPTVLGRAIERDAQIYPAHPKAPDFRKVRVGQFILNPH